MGQRGGLGQRGVELRGWCTDGHTQWAVHRFGRCSAVIVAVTVPSDQDFNLIPEIWIHREATNLELIYVESAGTRYQSLVNGINSYADHWKTLTSAERHALIYGIAAGVSAGFTAVDAAGTIIDFCATGGIGGLLWGAGKAIIGTAVTCNLASNHYQQVMLAQKAARSTETALVHMQNFAYELGISSNKVIYTPEIKSYTDLLCNFYSSTPFNGGHNFARPTTLPNMIIGAQHLPGYQAA
jgi:hypothetical protein